MNNIDFSSRHAQEPDLIAHFLLLACCHQQVPATRRVGRLQQASTTAVETLLGIMTDKAAPSGSRVRAAQCVVELSQKSFELEDLEEYVSQIWSKQRGRQVAQNGVEALCRRLRRLEDRVLPASVLRKLTISFICPITREVVSSRVIELRQCGSGANMQLQGQRHLVCRREIQK
jgi:hypothetical protein